jgi:hypothetical protein
VELELDSGDTLEAGVLEVNKPGLALIVVSDRARKRTVKPALRCCL